TPMLFCCAFLFQFLVAGLTGIMLSVAPFNWQLSDSYFVVAHFDVVLVASLLFTIFAAIYYWFPKVTGRMLSERLGRWHFWLLGLGFNITFVTMAVQGLLGMPRRLYPSRGPRLADLDPEHDARGAAADPRGADLRGERAALAATGGPGGRRPVGRLDARVGDHLAPAAVQLRHRSGDDEPPAALGSQAPGRPGRAPRVSPRGAGWWQSRGTSPVVPYAGASASSA